LIWQQVMKEVLDHPSYIFPTEKTLAELKGVAS